MADESKSSGLAWFVAGLSVGALVGILYAPKSGREMREDLAQGARDGADYVRARTRKAADNVTALVDKGKEQMSDTIGRGRAQWEEFVERGKNLVTDQSARVSAAVEAGRVAYHQTATAEPESQED